DYWEHMPELGVCVHHHLQPRKKFQDKPKEPQKMKACAGEPAPSTVSGSQQRAGEPACPSVVFRLEELAEKLGFELTLDLLGDDDDAGVYDCERSGCVVMEVAMLMARCPPWLVVVTLSQHHSNCSVELRSVCHAHDTGFVACEEVFRGVKNAMRPGPADKDGLGHDAFDLVVFSLADTVTDAGPTWGPQRHIAMAMVALCWEHAVKLQKDDTMSHRWK
ncbi:unnamed protein product, partial [Cladocopium goreaui]